MNFRGESIKVGLSVCRSVGLSVCLVCLVSAGAKADVVADFSTDPALDGWLLNSDAASWNESSGTVDVFGYNLASPEINFNGLHRVTFRARGRSTGIFNTRYEFKPSADWVDHVSYQRGNGINRSRFGPRYDTGRFEIDDIRISSTPATNQGHADWQREVYAGMGQAVRSDFDRSGLESLAATRATLQAGGDLKVVMLGDSIVNDTSHSEWDVLVQENTGASINKIDSVRGGTGAYWYKEENRLDSYVYQHNPDLLMIGGISNGTAENVREVIQQVRAESPDTEILLMTPVAGQQKHLDGFGEGFHVPDDGLYRNQLLAVALEEQVGFVDLTGAWEDFAATSGLGREYYLRDGLHMNQFGMQVTSRLLEEFFVDLASPVNTPEPGSLGLLAGLAGLLIRRPCGLKPARRRGDVGG